MGSDLMLGFKKLSAEYLDDFLYFFDHTAVDDHVGMSGCYCCYFHAAGSEADWKRRTPEDNREAAKMLIEAGRMNGYLAYADGKPVAWCHADARCRLIRLRERCSDDDDPTKVAAIVCLITAPAYRRLGIAKRLLQYVCDEYINSPFEVLEAYPKTHAEQGADNHNGLVDFYIKAGFEVVDCDNRAAVVRKRLQPALINV